MSKRKAPSNDDSNHNQPLRKRVKIETNTLLTGLKDGTYKLVKKTKGYTDYSGANQTSGLQPNDLIMNFEMMSSGLHQNVLPSLSTLKLKLFSKNFLY